MVSFYPPELIKSLRPNAVHEQQARLHRYYRSVGESAVAAEMDKLTREIIQFYKPLETREDFVESLERQAA
jgi:hypothetical protein